YKAERLGNLLGLSNLYLKDDGRNPSASLKDRAGAVAVARARSLGRKVAAGASTGNAASSLACLSAGTELKPVVFVPKAAPEAKLAQLLVYGATVLSVDGSYDDAFDLCLAACEEYGWYNRNTGYNAFTREGKKTVSFEIAEQSGWTAPDTVFVPVGDGNILSGVWKGFVELDKLGLIDKLPRLAAVQAEGSAAIARAFTSGRTISPVEGKTVADSIAVSLPRDGEAAVRALKESKGFAVTVSDAEILEAIKTTARTEGIFAEPAAAAGVAGLAKAARAGQLRKNEHITVIITGNGLKDVASARKTVGKPHLIRPDLKDLKRLIASLPKGALS
ncbi:MAG: threonine synthase, partial [Elusimicrobiota bacterium]